MKISLALGKAPVSVQTAWGCLTSNLALPGIGSLLAGRKSGYLQAAFALVGMALTTIYGVKFCTWFLQNSSRLQDPADPVAALTEMWLQVRWALLGIALFGLSWLWGLAAGFSIVRQAKARDRTVPPKLDRA